MEAEAKTAAPPPCKWEGPPWGKAEGGCWAALLLLLWPALLWPALLLLLLLLLLAAARVLARAVAFPRLGEGRELDCLEAAPRVKGPETLEVELSLLASDKAGGFGASMPTKRK
jgi:hypothetical protein